MVLSAPVADAGAARAPAWLDKLIRQLERSRQGVLFALTDAVPTQLGPVVRALSKVSPWDADDEGVLEVCLYAEELLTIKPGSRVLLRVRIEDLEWLNLQRPIFADRELRAVLWVDEPALAGLVRRAVDLFDWVSRIIPVPPKPWPDFALEGVRAALEVGDSFVWSGEGLPEVLRTLGCESMKFDARQPAWELAWDLAAPGLPIFNRVRSEHDAWRVRMALALAGREAVWVAHEPEHPPAGMWRLHAHMTDWQAATRRLADPGCKRPGLLAAWLDLDSEAIDWFETHPGSTLDDWDPTAVACASAPAWQLRRYGRDSAVAVARGLLRSDAEQPPEDPAMQAVWARGAGPWDARRGGAVAPRLVRALRALGNELASLELIEAADAAGFEDVATALRLRRWDRGADQRADELVEGLVARGDRGIAFMITEVWIVRATADADHRSLVAARLHLGDLHRAQGQTEQARVCFEAGLAALPLDPQEHDDLLLRCAALRKIGEVDADMSELASALDHLERSRQLAQRLVEQRRDDLDQRAMLLVLRSLGDAHRALAQPDRARGYLQDSLHIAREIVTRAPDSIKASSDLANVLARLGDTHRELADLEAARSTLAQSVAVHRALADRQPDRFDLTLDRAVASKQLGLVHEALGQIEEATRCHQDALELLEMLWRPIGGQLVIDHELESVLAALGRCYFHNAVRTAIEFHQRWLVVAERARDLEGQADALRSLGGSYRELGDLPRAINHFERALAIGETLGDLETQAQALRGLSGCYRAMGDRSSAHDHQQRAHIIETRVGRELTRRALR